MERNYKKKKFLSLDDLIYILSHKNTSIDGGFMESDIETDFEITPQSFLKFSELDLVSTSDHKYINALSNAKRALDCQLDTLLIGFGFYKISKDKNWGFPKKIEILNTLGIIAPRVLSKINKARNLMEHEFKVPNSEKVEDFIDIVALFLAATDSYTFKYKYYKDLWIETEREFDFGGLAIEVVYKVGKIVVIGKFLSDSEGFIEYEFEISNKEEKYLDVLKGFLAINVYT